jgi:hypothetical protein
MDETYIKVKGQWRYLYRAVDKYGETIDFLLTEHRDTKAAAPADQRERLSQAVAAVYASDGGRADGSGVDPTGGAPVPRATVATASGGVSKQGGGKRHGKGA